MLQESLYAILGIPMNAQPDEIIHAYRRCAMKWHPDHGSDNERDEMFRRIAGAYMVLSAPTKRAIYDRSLNEAGRRHRLKTLPQSVLRPAMPDVSMEEAEKLFSEQLLGLACQLAAHGYDEGTLVKALIALGSSSGRALSVGSVAIKQAAIKMNAKTKVNALSSKEEEAAAPAQMSFKFVMQKKFETVRLPMITPSLFARW